MLTNVLTKFEHYIPFRKDFIYSDEVHLIGLAYDKVYSYQVLMCISEGNLMGWQINILLSENDDYNTISKNKLMTGIMHAIVKTDSKAKVLVDFEQPPLELLIKLYEPLVNKLANEEKLHWKQFEFDDLCQMCRLAICTLYSAGYFIHKSLIRTTFVRMILSELRLRGDEYEAIPMHKLNKDDLEYINCIEDESVEDEFKEIIDGSQQYIDDRKKTVIGIIGQRQYDQIVREYRTGTTTGATQKLVHKLKTELSEVKNVTQQQ